MASTKKRTPDVTLRGGMGSKVQLQLYLDADCARKIAGRRSTSDGMCCVVVPVYRFSPGRT